MQIVNCGEHTASSAEDVAHQVLLRSNVAGVAFANLLTGGRKSREIDLLVCTESGRLVVVEVKGTSQAGQLSAFANSAWQIGDKRAFFAGGPQPHRQAKVAASRVAMTLNYSRFQHPWVEWVVAIAGPVGIDHPVKVDNGWVCRLDQLPSYLARAPERSFSNPSLVENLFAVFKVPRPVSDAMTNPQFQTQPNVQQRVQDPTQRSKVTASAADARDRHWNARPSAHRLPTNKSSKWNRAWFSPNPSWSFKRRFWAFLLLWYVGCLVVYGFIYVAATLAGRWPIQPGSGMDYLIGACYIFWTIAVFAWIMSGRKRVLE